MKGTWKLRRKRKRLLLASNDSLYLQPDDEDEINFYGSPGIDWSQQVEHRLAEYNQLCGSGLNTVISSIGTLRKRVDSMSEASQTQLSESNHWRKLEKATYGALMVLCTLWWLYEQLTSRERK